MAYGFNEDKSKFDLGGNDIVHETDIADVARIQNVVTEKFAYDWLDVSGGIRLNKDTPPFYITRLCDFPSGVIGFAGIKCYDANDNEINGIIASLEAFGYYASNTPGYEYANHIETLTICRPVLTETVTLSRIDFYYLRLIDHAPIIPSNGYYHA